MYTIYKLKRGGIYTSPWCFRHPHLENNFKGDKRDMSTWAYKPEFIEHMKAVKLEVKEVDGKSYLMCPKCHIQIELYEDAKK